MYNFFKKKHSQLDHTKNIVQDYYSIKEKLELPLKIKLFLEMLENHADESSQKKKIPKEITDIYKAFSKSFQKLSFQHKYFFMLAMVKIVQDLLTEMKEQNGQSCVQYECKIDKIQTSCQIRQQFMGVSRWESKLFKFFNVQKILKICSLSNTQKQNVFQLTLYHLRTSTKQKNTLVLESIFDSWKIPQKYRNYYIHIKDSRLFIELYNNLRNAIIMTWKSRLIGMLNESQNQNIQKMNGTSSSTGVRMLNSKVVSEYFKTKQKIVSKVLNKQIKFKIFSQIRKVKIYRSSKYQNLYKSENIIDHPYQSVLKSIELINGVPVKKLLHYQKMQNFSNTISAVYYKYMVKGCTHQMLSIVEQYNKQNQCIVTFKAIDNYVLQKNVDFIEIKVQKIGGKTRIGVFGFVNFDQNKKLNPISIIDFFLSIVQYQGGEQNLQHQPSMKNQTTLQIQSEKIGEQISDQNDCDQDDFHTVVGDNFDSDQDRQLQICNTFQSPKRQEQGFEEIDQGETEHERNMMTQFRNQQYAQKSRRLSILINQNLGSNQIVSGLQYLKKKYMNEPQKSSQQKDLLKQHFFIGEWAKHQRGGVFSLNTKCLDRQKQVYRSLLARLGNAIMKKQISNLSIPVIALKAESQLQAIARNFSYTPLMLENLQQKSPLQKMKNAIIVMISMGTIGLSMNKPFNPVIGETYQAYIDNCPIYMQQIEHHPSTSTVYLKGRGYQAYGSVIPSISIRLNTVKCFSPAPIYIKFQNGGVIQFPPSKMLIGGLLVGQRTFDFIDTTFLMDQANRIIAQIAFGPKKKFGKQMKGDKNDFIWGFIYQVSQCFMSKFIKEGKHLSPSIDKTSRISGQIYGCWNQKIYIDESIFFDFQTQLPCKLVRQKHTLRSDSNLRSDIKYLSIEDYSNSQDQKDRLEYIQRNDARLRKIKGKK